MIKKLFKKWFICRFQGHSVGDPIRKLNKLAKARCEVCGQMLCLNLEQGTCMSWSPRWDHDFDRMEKRRCEGR